MSQTKNSAEGKSVGANVGHLELSRMMRQGRSWSGRERNCCFLNIQADRFADISGISGMDFADDARAIAITDWDHDGDVDLWVSNRNAPRLRLMRNNSGQGNRYVAFLLSGNGTTTNRDAIGARVEVVIAGEPVTSMIRTLRAGEGFLAQSSKWLHFGLGDSERIDKVIVRWPAGEGEEYRGIQSGRRYRLVQGTGQPTEWTRDSPAKALLPSSPELPPSSRVARIPLVTLLSIPAPLYQELESCGLLREGVQGKAVLVNLWASWCAPCLEELKEFARREKEIRAAGIEVLALAVDGLGDDGSDPALAEDSLSRLRFPFSHGRATSRLVGLLQSIRDGLLPLHRTLPVPTSFLIDAQGRLAVIYKGPLSIDVLLEDVTHSQQSRMERQRQSASLAGRMLESPEVVRAAITEEANMRFRFAELLSKEGLSEDAIVQYRDVLKINPDFAEAHNNLGLAYVTLNTWQEAAVHFRNAIRIRPKFAEAYLNLGTLLLKRNDLDGAEAQFLHAVRIQPEFAGAHNHLGLAYAKQGKMEQAAECFEKEIQVNPEFHEPYNYLGFVYLQRNQNTPAARLLERAIELEPNYADARNNLGIVYKRQGKTKQAAEQYEWAVRIQPNFVEARNNLGALYVKQGRLDEARAQFEKALSIRPDYAAARDNLNKLPASRGN